MILSLRTDNPEAEIGLFDGQKELAYVRWQADRELSDTIHHKIRELLDQQKLDWTDLTGIIFFAGPGSFTGLRIGASVAQALSYSLAIPLIGANSKSWLKAGLAKLRKGEYDQILTIEYGAEPNITKPIK